ncbi:MAG: tryptophan synthase subunit alpha, partial [Oleibacter sp.]|nr:tryptophan synthase subunit alpha [Thalassolituus sp.]
MSRINTIFTALKEQGKKALIPYITAGDPTKEVTVPMMHALVEAGADIIEIGVPFSDPMADGPTIQLACERALLHGTSLRDVLKMITEFRQTNNHTAVVLMGYLNPVEAMGYQAFVDGAIAAGVDGVLMVDLPPEEAVDVDSIFKDAGLDVVYLIAPTTTDKRIESIGHSGSG